jgi:hypothetical protein
MTIPVDPDTVSHGIRLAFAPVFLLTAVAGMIDAVAHRLGRIIDHARNLEARLESNANPAKTESIYSELAVLQKRALLANLSIGLLTFSAFLIGVTIVVLFLGGAVNFQNVRISVASFLAGVLCFLLALCCFMAETLIATRLLYFPRPKA